MINSRLSTSEPTTSTGNCRQRRVPRRTNANTGRELKPSTSWTRAGCRGGGGRNDCDMALATPTMRIATSGSPFLPRLLPPALFSAQRLQQVRQLQFSLPLFPAVALAVPASFQWSLPSLPSILEGIWEGILKAVPKKKTSHMKKRHRQMAGKALKDVTHLCKCPSCGKTKRMHYLCPYCTASKGSLRDCRGSTDGDFRAWRDVE